MAISIYTDKKEQFAISLNLTITVDLRSIRNIEKSGESGLSMDLNDDVSFYSLVSVLL